MGSTFDTAFGLSPSAVLRAGFDRLRTQLRMSPGGLGPLQGSVCLPLVDLFHTLVNSPPTGTPMGSGRSLRGLSGDAMQGTPGCMGGVRASTGILPRGQRSGSEGDAQRGEELPPQQCDDGEFQHRGGEA